MCACVCECVPVALSEQVGPLCMGSRQPVLRTTDCGQAYCAQHEVCGRGTDILRLDASVVSVEYSFTIFMALFHSCQPVQITDFI